MLVSVARAWPAWCKFLAYWGVRVAGWTAKLAGVHLPPPPPAGVRWGAVGYLALAVLPLWIARTIWRRWNEAEMRQLVARRHANPRISIYVLTAIWIQILFTLGVATGSMPGFLLFMATLWGVMMPILWLQPRLPIDAASP